MPCICYVPKSFRAGGQEMVRRANAVIVEYAAQGYTLTLRQLYYQFVARGWLANQQREYMRLGEVVNDGRLAGLIDWDALEDRTRNLHQLASWTSPADIVEACGAQYRRDRWEGQKVRVEVWVEKEALAGVFERICDELRVPLFACRGYVSQSEMWAAGQRLKEHAANGQRVHLLHFGDHDPSEMPMSLDIADRLELFGANVEFRRLALNMDQVEEYGPPPNPAKMSDSRAEDYVERYGDESWELDALDPAVLAGLVRTAVVGLRDARRWAAGEARELAERRQLAAAAQRWPEVADLVGDDGEEG